MPLTRSFRETVRARARRDVKFRQALLGEAMQALLDGSLEEGRSALRSCINDTIGFEKLGAALGRSPKSLMRMFGPSGNPTADNLLAVIGLLQEEACVRLQVRAVAHAAFRKPQSMSNFVFLAAVFPAVHESALHAEL